LENANARQYGRYFYSLKSNKADSRTKRGDEAEDNEAAPIDYRKNVTVEMADARTMKVLWSKSYPKESPRAWIALVTAA
jgi:hypothetical protein